MRREPVAILYRLVQYVPIEGPRASSRVVAWRGPSWLMLYLAVPRRVLNVSEHALVSRGRKPKWTLGRRRTLLQLWVFRKRGTSSATLTMRDSLRHPGYKGQGTEA
eukprot:6478973-Amphidinium_carterae.1